MKFKIILFLFFSFLLANIGISQNIKGLVLDSKTKVPVAGASVYFDNTTLGQMTNFDGEFSFFLENEINAPLVISFVGYKSVIVSEFSTDSKITIYLEEDISVLDEVLISSNKIWSRAYKLKAFKKQFLGFSKFSESCEILNEDDIILRFDEKAKQLTAFSKQPIIVLNKALDYEIIYDLKAFEINYISSNKITRKVQDNADNKYRVHDVYYSGTSFFKPVVSDKHKKALKNRKKAYKGSVLHFMRSVAEESLTKNKFRIFRGAYQVLPEQFIKVFKKDKATKVSIKKRLSILYKKEQSSIKSTINEFGIDLYGNHSPIQHVLFGGAMGNQRMGDALPLDYGITSKK